MAFHATVKVLLIALIALSITEVLAKRKRSRSNGTHSRDYSKKYKPSIESHLPFNRTECTTTAIDYLLGAEVKKISRKGRVRTLNATRHLGQKVVALYFSAMWCKHSQCFTPVLRNMYSKISRKSFEIIYVSQNCATMEEKMRRQEYSGWPYISCEDPAGEKLVAHYKIKRLPAVIIVNPAGIPIAKYTQTRLLQRSADQLLREWLAMC